MIFLTWKLFHKELTLNPPTHFTFILNLSFISCNFYQSVIIFSVKALLFRFVRPIFNFTARHLSVQVLDAATSGLGLSYLFESIKWVTTSVISRAFSSHRVPASINLLLQKQCPEYQKSFREGLLSKWWQTVLKQGIKGKARQGALSVSVTGVSPQVLLLQVSYTCNKVHAHSAYFYIRIHKPSKSGKGKHFPKSADSPQHSVWAAQFTSMTLVFAMQEAVAFMEMLSLAFRWMHIHPQFQTCWHRFMAISFICCAPSPTLQSLQCVNRTKLWDVLKREGEVLNMNIYNIKSLH